MVTFPSSTPWSDGWSEFSRTPKARNGNTRTQSYLNSRWILFACRPWFEHVRMRDLRAAFRRTLAYLPSSYASPRSRCGVGGDTHTDKQKSPSALNATLQTDRETLNWRNWPVKSVPIDSLIINEPFVVVCRLAEGWGCSEKLLASNDVHWIDR